MTSIHQIPTRGNPHWSPAEDAIALQEETTLAARLELLPGRTVHGLHKRLAVLRGTRTVMASTCVPAQECAELARRQMREHRLNHRELVVAAGWNDKSLWMLLHGKKKRLAMETYDRLKTLPYLDRVERFWLPAKATTLRLQALACQGYTVDHIGAMLGKNWSYGKPKAKVVKRTTAQGVLDLLVQLRDTVGPSECTVSKAATAGWRHEREYRRDRFYDIEWNGQGSLARTADHRFEDLEFLLDSGVTLETAWVRAGYRTEGAALQALGRDDKRGSQAA